MAKYILITDNLQPTHTDEQGRKVRAIPVPENTTRLVGPGKLVATLEGLTPIVPR